MLVLSGVKIKTTTDLSSRALQNFTGYTLSNTPFYFRIEWSILEKEEYKNLFTKNKIVWDFGDGTQTYGPSAQHFYSWPGEYNATATIYDVNGDVHILNTDKTLKVFNVMPDIVTVGGLQNNDSAFGLFAGKKSPPLRILRYNSWQYDTELSKNRYTVNFYASGCNSTAATVSAYYSSQWSHLKAYHAFVKQSVNQNNILTENIIDSTDTTSVSVYAEPYNTGKLNNQWDIKFNFLNYPKEGTCFCGTSGTLSESTNVFFVNQKPAEFKKTDVVFIYGNFDTSIFIDKDYFKYNYQYNNPYGFLNTTWSTQVVKTLFNPAESIEISSNGITAEGEIDKGTLEEQKIYSFDIYPIKFTNTKIPFIATLKDGEKFTTKCYPLLSLNKTGDLKLNDINFSLVQVTLTGNRLIPEAEFNYNDKVPVFEKSGSYCPVTLSIPIEVESVAISARALVQDGVISIPNKGVGILMQPGLDSYRKFVTDVSYGYPIDSKKFQITTTSIYNTLNLPCSGGVTITYVPGYLKNSTLSGEYIWISDSNRDRIYCIFEQNDIRLERFIDLRRLTYRNEINGILSRPVTLDTRSGTGINRSSSPCDIVADVNGDVWITLRDCVSSFKIDKETLIATRAVVPSFSGYGLYSNTDYYKTSGFAGENLILPTSIDIDRNNNIYVSYSHPLSSCVIKYDSDCNQLNTILFNYPFVVKQIYIDAENNLWVTTFNNSPIDDLTNPQTPNIVDRIDRLYYINFSDSKKNFFKTFSFIGDLTIDVIGYVWIHHRNNLISRISNTGEVLTFTIGNPESSLDYVQDFGAFGGDMNGNLWIVNNTEGMINYFDVIEPKQQSIFDMGRVVLPDISLVNPTYNNLSYYRTFGDFTGIKWFMRNQTFQSTSFKTIEGISNLFSIYDREASNNIIKYNENYPLGDTIKSYALQESLFNSTNFFDNFLKPVIQGSGEAIDEVGKIIYEKISNFVDNNSDIDKCNIRSLRSMFNLVGDNLDTFFESVPPDMRRVIDLLSIKKSLLYGGVNNYFNNFSLSSVDYDVFTNLGPEIDIEAGYFIPGKPIITYEFFSKKYNVIQSTIVPESNVVILEPYPLSAIKPYWGWRLVLPKKDLNYKDIKNYYKFYEFIPSKKLEMLDGVIDFKEEKTTLSPINSTYNDWTKFGGIMDRLIGTSVYYNLFN